MTYGLFLLLFLAVPLTLLLLLTRARLQKRDLLVLAALGVVALIYTGPWDNLLIASGVWTYGRDRVIGLTIGRVPVEEYVFYLLQVGVGGLFTFRLIGGRALAKSSKVPGLTGLESIRGTTQPTASATGGDGAMSGPKFEPAPAER